MQIGSYLWSGFNETVGYGFRKLDEGAACISESTLAVAYNILQTRPESLFSNRFSPRFHEAMLWVEDNQRTINLVVNFSMIVGNTIQGEIGLDTIAHLLQLSIDEKSNPKWNRLLTLINAVNIYQIGTSQLLEMRNLQIFYNLINSCAHLHNICYNSSMISNSVRP